MRASGRAVVAAVCVLACCAQGMLHASTPHEPHAPHPPLAAPGHSQSSTATSPSPAPAAAARRTLSGTHTPGGRHNSSLVNELRRQLMENNYDYMPSESEEPLGPRRPLFNQKAVEEAPPPAAPLDRSYAPPDKTRLEFDLEFNNPNMAHSNTDNNINTADANIEAEVGARPDDRKKEYDNLDRDYTDLKRKHDEIEKAAGRLDADYAKLKKEHDELKGRYDRDPPNREYDEEFDESTPMVAESDTNGSSERRRPPRDHSRLLDDQIRERLRIHHGGNGDKRNEYIQDNVESDVRPRSMRADGNREPPASRGARGRPRARDRSAPGDSSGMSKKHGVHKNDLLYYMNDERLKQAERNYLDLSNAGEDGSSSSGSGSGNSSDDYNDKTTTVKYNVFTVIAEGGGRRAAGSGGRRAFVREQRPGEVVVVRLDDAPFPQFRLPAARRQYMHSAESKH